MKNDCDFQLFETMYATRDDGVRNLDRHIKRLGNSALYFAFRFDEAAFCQELSACCWEMLPNTPYRIRATLDKTGELNCVVMHLMPLESERIGVLLAPELGLAPPSSSDQLLLHKTTRRGNYDLGWRTAESCGAFDTLFFNERGELTEGGRSNVFVRIGARWWTPPLLSGLLPGVMCAVMLEDALWSAAERVLRLKDIERADGLIVCKSLRGALPAYVMRTAI
jgi:para-aminobenzoate synthetase/4-amino-4-deoxychorismate lyase